MRIATISYHGSPLAAPGAPSTGGMQVYVRELGRALAAEGHQVDVFTRQATPAGPAVVTDRPGFRVINLPAGVYTVRWLDPVDCQTLLTETIDHPGRRLPLTLPLAADDLVLLLKKQSGRP